MENRNIYKIALRDEMVHMLNESSVSNKTVTQVESFKVDTFFNNKMHIVGIIRDGVTYSFFDMLRTYAPFTEEDWAAFLGISTKSLQRYQKSMKKFKPIHSEKIIEIAEVIHQGMEVFGDMNKLKLWLNTPNYALHNHTPKNLLSDSYGKELVLTELVHIDFGIFV